MSDPFIKTANEVRKRSINGTLVPTISVLALAIVNEKGETVLQGAGAPANLGASIPQVSVTAEAVDETVTFTVTVTDANGKPVTERKAITVWFSATSFGAPTDLGTLTVATGDVVNTVTADALVNLVTDASGVAVLEYEAASSGTIHAMVSLGGATATASGTADVQ